MLTLLKSLAADPKVTHLFLLGDIFDLWIADHSYFETKYRLIIDHLAALQRRGVGIHYFEGNHDLYLNSFWQKRLGFIVHDHDQVFQIGSYRVRAEHGDLIDKDDRGYRFLRWLLRTPVVKLLAHHLPSLLVAWIGEKTSRASRAYTSQTKTIEREHAVQKIREHAMRLVQKDPALDFIISGHLHIRDDFALQKGEKTVRSINLGTWMDTPVAFVIEADAESHWQNI